MSGACRAVVVTNVVPLLSEPDDSADPVSMALLGETVSVCGVRADFALAETPDGHCGWMPRSGLRDLPEGATYPGRSPGAVVRWLVAPVLDAPRGSAGRLALLSAGSVVEPCEQKTQGHTLVRLPDGSTGWMRNVALAPVRAAGRRSPTPRTVGRTALRWAHLFLGVPYRWGGRSAFGIDCSGLAQMAFGLSGVVLPRDAYLQAAYEGFEPVPRGEVSAGDLVFFGSVEDPHGQGIAHVGLALDDRWMIHAADGVGVVISRHDTPPYDPVYRCARRLRSAARSCQTPCSDGARYRPGADGPFRLAASRGARAGVGARVT